MHTFLNLGHSILNIAHIVSAEFTPPVAGGDTFFNEEDGVEQIREPRQAQLALTLTSVSREDSYDYDGAVQGSAAVSDVIKLSGAQAEAAGEWLERQAVNLVPLAS